MSTGYGWEGLRQVCATLLGARHVPERLCGGFVYLGLNKMFTFFMFRLFAAEVSAAFAMLCIIIWFAYEQNEYRHIAF